MTRSSFSPDIVLPELKGSKHESGQSGDSDRMGAHTPRMAAYKMALLGRWSEWRDRQAILFHTDQNGSTSAFAPRSRLEFPCNARRA